MHNVIYTSVFSIGWNYFNGLQQWQIYNLYHMQKYCERHNIELRIIDNSDSNICKIFNYARNNSGWMADSWNIGTLSSILALEKFSKNKELDNFFWLDADICITQMDYNIFDLLNKDNFYIETSEYKFNEKKNLFYSYFYNKYHIINNKNRLSCYSGIFGMNRNVAENIIQFLHDYDIDILNYEKFIDSMIELFYSNKHFISDECIFEVLVNSYIRYNTINIKDFIDIKVITPDSDKNFDSDVFCYHFASEAKYLIPSFWNYRSSNEKFNN